MPELANGRFVGLTADEKARRVLQHLSYDTNVSLADLQERTGLTASQVHVGIRHLREVKGEQCVITYRRGALSTYKLAANAPEVSDYAVKRMLDWQTQVKIMKSEMVTCMDIGLPEHDKGVYKQAVAAVEGLQNIFEAANQARAEIATETAAALKEIEKKERELAREREKLERQREKFRLDKKQLARTKISA
jgi:DNA-binding Lrp family transcriptional regulator